MSAFNRQSLLAWLHQHRGRAIAIRARRSSLALTGVCEGVEDLDACSTEYTSCAIRMAVPDAEVSITLHDTALSLHVLLRDPASGRTAFSVPVTIAYPDLILELAEDRERAARRGREAEPALSTPYRLLH